ncbi:hypothetical protein AK812_SmicGene35422 [Symbiodinium microadriaticum]|uniref:Uncharacterized protein n=1 Tax=Symbiodinium microadriaticum TaxID=2951 RepID=A0A1Q9CLI6_SYMMI|nr:hypothetical protein AK812_SmicGene35422 [Symbiodinium microadriaticum]
MTPSACALLRSQAGPHAGAWLTAIPADPATTLSPASDAACAAPLSACPRPALLAWRAKIVEQAWVREAVGADGQVVLQQWLFATTAPRVALDDRPRLELVIFGALRMGGALCCDATLVSPLTRTGQPQPGTAAHDGAMLRVAERRKRAAYPELRSEIGGRWNEAAQQLVRDLACVLWL